MAYVIAEPCMDVKDTACVDPCPVDGIHPKEDEPLFEAEKVECIACGACVPVCPVSAIFTLVHLPKHWTHLEQLNSEAFAAEKA